MPLLQRNPLFESLLNDFYFRRCTFNDDYSREDCYTHKNDYQTGVTSNWDYLYDSTEEEEYLYVHTWENSDQSGFGNHLFSKCFLINKSVFHFTLKIAYLLSIYYLSNLISKFIF